MKIFRTRKQFLVFFMPGFLLGIIYVNFIARKYMAEPGIFSDYFLNQFQSASIDAREYIWYLLRVRAVPFLALAGLSFTKVRKPAAVLFLVWTGISGGILISAAVLNMGIKGSAVFAVCSGICGAAVALLYSSPDPLEPPEDGVRISCDGSGDHPGDVCKSCSREGVPFRALKRIQTACFLSSLRAESCYM